MSDEVPLAQRFPPADELRPFVGRWVAVKAGVVVADFASMRETLDWLADNETHADSLFRVPTCAANELR